MLIKFNLEANAKKKNKSSQIRIDIAEQMCYNND